MHGIRAEVQVVMGTESVKRQATGASQTFVGRIKRAIGRLFGSRRLQVEGGAEELRCRANVAAGRAGERIEGAVQETAGTVKRKAGEVIERERPAVEGRAKEMEGRARRELNR
jgi:uncharacterized protein YjbJ (UPF0337 family)